MSQVTQEEIDARYNAETPLNVLTTTVMAMGFVLRKRANLPMDDVTLLMDDATQLATLILAGRLRVTENGFMPTPELSDQPRPTVN